jgi:hypothetical protein
MYWFINIGVLEFWPPKCWSPPCFMDYSTENCSHNTFRLQHSLLSYHPYTICQWVWSISALHLVMPPTNSLRAYSFGGAQFQDYFHLSSSQGGQRDQGLGNDDVIIFWRWLWSSWLQRSHTTAPGSWYGENSRSGMPFIATNSRRCQSTGLLGESCSCQNDKEHATNGVCVWPCTCSTKLLSYH